MLPFQELLNPIPGTNPSGQYLRYVVYDEIKEARREDDDLDQGIWTFERKKVDFAKVLKLCSEALASKSKDLQLAVWATEAVCVREGLPGLDAGIQLIAQLLDKYWDTIYPELESGNADMRVGALQSLTGIANTRLHNLPLTLNRLTWGQYFESREVGFERDADTQEKKDKRKRSIEAGKVTGEDFEQSVAKTSRVFFEERIAEADACLASIASLDDLCGTKMSKPRPSFTPLRKRLEEYRQTLTILQTSKGGLEAVATKKSQQNEGSEAIETQTENAVEAQEESETDESVAEQEQVSAAAVPISEEPTDSAEALEWIAKAARCLRREDPCNPVPYAVMRALRWTELRTQSGGFDTWLLTAPSTETRKRLKGLAQNESWEELLQACEEVMATPCSRGWLDLQRYAVTACDSIGRSYDEVAATILSGLEAFLREFRRIADATFDDETATANQETQTWLREVASSKMTSDGVLTAHSRLESPESYSSGESLDAFDLAKQAISSGNTAEAMAILEREAARECSGRGRFQRRLQLAELCIAANHRAVALPVLQSLAREIDERKLEDWEEPELMLHTFGLLYQCMEKMKGASEQKEAVYARICRLAPTRALAIGK